MSLEIKPGVTLLGLVPQMVVALIVVEDCYDSVNAHCTITAGNDGSHSITSEHYAGRALDFRTRELESPVAAALAKLIKQSLGRDFVVLLEADHLHVHYKPQRPEAVIPYDEKT